MAINQLLGADKILRMNDFELLGMVQSEDWSPNFNAEDIFEMGQEARIDTASELELAGSLEVQSIGGTPGLLARAIVQRSASGDFTGYLFDAGGGGGENAYTLTQTDFKEAEFDLVMHERPDRVSYTRSVVFPRCFVASISGRADANGSASETVNWQNDFVIGLDTPYHDCRAIPATVDITNDFLVMADTGVTTATHTIIYAYIGSIRLDTDTMKSEYVAFSTTTHRLAVTGLDLDDFATETARVIVYLTTPGSTFPSITNRTTTAFYVRGWQATIYIAPAMVDTPTASERWLRVQSADWTIDFRLEALRQILQNTEAGNAVYVRQPVFPIDITLNATVLETDWADWKAVLGGKTFPGTDVYEDSYDFAPSSMTSSFDVRVDYFTKAGAQLQEWQFNDMRVDGYGNRANIGGRGEVTWTLRGTTFSVEGFNA